MTVFPTGWFVICSELKGLVGNVKDGYTNPGDPNNHLAKQSGGDGNQVWRYSNGFFINKRSGLVLGCSGAGAITAQVKQDIPRQDDYGCLEGLSIKLIEWNRNLQQQWGYDNDYMFSHADTNLVLDVNKGATKSGINIIIYSQKSGGSDNLKWKLEPM